MTGLSTWVPSDVLVGALTLVVGYLFKRILEDSKETKDALKSVTTELQAIRLQQTGYATKDELGRMGDRFDGRVTNLAQDVAVMKAVQGAK